MAAQATAEDEIGEEGLDDMINLSVLTEQALLTNIHRRYDRQHIYTYVGSILVAVNPYKMFNIYGVDMVRKYEGQVLGTLPPHLFAIGSSAYSKMLKDNQSQVIVISGESGAGKTESTKLIMQYLAVVNQSDNNLVTEQILEASPLLEAFGNAKTIRNDNSSRFGKYVEVYFNNGKIIGAKNSEYLLEKSRIVTQNKDERNYHVFYEMLMGMDVKTKKKYGLLEPADYFYLNRGGNWGIPGKDEAGDFSKLKAAMDVLAFSTEEQENIFKILAAILQLGNVYFKKKGNDNQDGVEIGEENEIKWVALLLQLPEDWLKEALTTKVTEARQERLLTPFTVAQALDARDAIAKALYQRLFTWLVERINQIVYKSDKSVSIAILDIFGFEDFKINSFEQLCINYANEALQLYFNRHIFRLEQEAYSKERINWEVIDFQDNQPVIDLLARKPSGLIHLLDDESHFPKGTDQSFLDKCHYNYSVTSLYSKPKLASLDFVINHYAGHVNYNVKGFIEKNKDTLRSDVVELLIQSENEMISEMFRKLRDKLVTRTVNKATGRFMTMKPKTPTVAANFNESLLKLIDRMSKCNPLFVRCIKPNASKQAMTFETSVVLDQLRYTGMLETIRIRKLGYPIRMRFTAFIDRFHCLMDGKKLPNRSNPKNVCDVIMTKVGGVPFQQYQLGTTRVFMRESFNTHLESERHTVLRRAVIVIQKYARAFVARKQYHRMVSASIRLQASIRRWIQRSKYVLMRKGFIKTQAQYRMRRQRKLYIQRRDEHRRRIEEDRIALEMAKQKAEREAKEKKARAVANVSRLEIPPELAFIFSQIDSWRPMHDTRHIIQTENVQLRESNVQLPEDVNSYAFTKYTNVYFKNHSWQMKRQPVKSSFLQKQTKQEAKQSVGIFQLVMRFMNDAHLAGKKETILGNYIVQQGLKNANLRDEIYCQLCTQTWKNNNVSNCERGWILMANCLSCFPPSPTLYNYLLKYVSDHAYNGYKPYCQYKLLQCSEIERPLARTYPPCLLEWMASKKRMNMAVPITFPDGQEMLGHVTSWSTSEDFAHDLLQLRMIVENNYGWTVSLQDDYATYELAGYDYVLDLLSEMEIPPKFPTLKSYFLVSIDRRRTTEARRNASDDSPHNPDSFNTLDIEVEELLQTPPPIRRTPPPPQPSSQPRRPVVEQNHDNVTSLLSQDSKLNQRPAVVTTPGLSRQSRMNERYTKRMAPAPPRAPSPVLEEPEINVNTLLSDSKLNNRYVSVVQVNGGLPNGRPVNGHGVPNGRVPNGSAPQMNGNGFDLSSSKLNQRYSKSNNAAQQRNKNFRKQGSREMLRSKSIISEDGRSIRSSNPTDMDQWVDNVFDQVLDSDFDGLSDARTLENNIRGGKKCVSDHSDREAQSAHLEEWIDDLFENITDEDLKRMSDCELVSESLKGGGKGIPGYSQPGPHVSNINVGLPQTAGSLNFGSNASLNIPGLPGALPMYNPGLVPPMGAYHQDPGQAFAVQQALQVQQTANIQASLQQTVLENQLLQHSLQQEVLKQQLQQLQLQTYQMTATNPVPVGVPTVAPSHLDLQSGVVPNGQVPHAGLIAPVPAPLQVVTAAPNAVGNIKSTFERQSSVESKNSSFEFRRSSEESRRSSADSRRSSTDRQPQSPPKFPKPITGATSNRNRGVAFSDAVENIPRESISEEDPLSPAPAISPSRQREVVKSAAPPAPPAPTSPVKHSAPSQLPPPPATYYEHVDVPEVFDNLEPIPEDVEGRAKTIRVGKVRWPPLVEKKGNKKEHVGKLFIEEQKQTPESLRTKTAGQLHDQTMQLIRARSNENLIDDGEQPSTSAAKPRPERSQSAPKKLDMSRLSVLETHMKSRVNSLPTTPVSQKKPAPRPPAIEKVALPPPPPPPPISTIPQFGAPPPPPPPLVMATRPLPSPPVETSVQTETLVKVASKVSMHSEIIQTEDVDVVDAESMDELDEVPLILDHGQLERIKTELYQAFSGPFYTYSNVPWNLNVRKEVFTPGEKLENNLVVHLIFCQIVNDVFNGSSIRIHKDDRVRMKTLLENNGITQDNVLTRDHKHQVKKNVVELAREWPIYFSRLFPVYGGRRSPDMQYLSIGHSGIRLLHREKDLVEDKFEILDHCKYSDVLEVQVPRDDAIQLNLDGEWVIAYTPRAKQIKNLVDAFCIEAEKDSLYVKAVKNYITHESTLLCFKKGDLIKLTNKDMKLDRGWLYGSLYGRAGMFPEAYVVKLSKTELRRSQKRTAPAPPAEITLSNGNGVDSQSDIISQTGSIIADGKYSMIEFAVMNFRESLNKYEMLRTDDGSIRGTIKKIESFKLQHFLRSKRGHSKKGSDWTWQEHAEMVKWTRSPIQASLLRLPNSQLNKLALECFICIMQYMGDYPMDSSHDDLDCAMRLLRTCHKNRELIDEVYCQLCKQTTNNKSTRPDSCQRGWKLFVILAAWFKCSDALLPYLDKYLQTVAFDESRPYRKPASVSLQNLRTTFRYGGRKNVPQKVELEALTSGRYNKRQGVMTPGGVPVTLNLKSSTVVEDVIAEITAKLNIKSSAEREEYSLFYVVEKDNHFCSIARDEYAFDITTELSNMEKDYYLLFQRTSWVFPIHSDGNDFYTEMMFNQVKPDYQDGLLMVLEGGRLHEEQKRGIARLAALQFRASDRVNLPTMKDMADLLPEPLLNMNDTPLQMWVNLVHDRLSQVQRLSPLSCKIAFLDELSRWILFGSTFFMIKGVTDPRVPGRCLMAINKDGVHLLHTVTHESYVSYHFRDVVSSRHAQIGMTSYLDVKIGDLMSQKIVRIETDQTGVISPLIGKYIQVLSTIQAIPSRKQ